MIGIVYVTQAAAQADQAKVATALGYPICNRINSPPGFGTACPPCACVGNGKGAHVDAACPYATRRQTDIVQCTGGFGLIVDPVMQASAPVLAAVPAAAVPVTLTGVTVLAVAVAG